MLELYWDVNLNNPMALQHELGSNPSPRGPSARTESKSELSAEAETLHPSNTYPERMSTMTEPKPMSDGGVRSKYVFGIPVLVTACFKSQAHTFTPYRTAPLKTDYSSSSV